MRRTITLPSASTASRPATRAARRAVAQRAHRRPRRWPPGRRASRCRARRSPRPASRPAAARVRLQRGERHPGAGARPASTAGVDLAELGEARRARARPRRRAARRRRPARCCRPAARSARRARAQARRTAATSSRVARPHDERRASARSAAVQSVSYGARTSSSVEHVAASPTTRRQRGDQASAIGTSRTLPSHAGMRSRHEHTRPSSRSRRRRSSSGRARPRTRAGSSSGSASRRALLVTDPGVAATGHPDRVRAAIEAEGIEVVVYDRARVEPTLESLQDAADFALDARRRRLRLRRRRLGDRHGEGRRPDRLPPRAGDGLRQPADRRGPQAARRRCKPHLAIPTTSGTGERGDHGRRARHPRAEGQVGDLPPLHAPAPGDRRPGAHAHAGRRGRRLGRPRRGLPRRRVLPRQAVRRAPAAGDPRRPPALPGLQPGRRRVVGEGARVRRRATCAARSRTPTTSRRAAG